MYKGTYAGGQGASAPPALFQEGQRGQAVIFNTELLYMTKTLASHFMLFSKYFTVTFPIEENLKAKIYPCDRTYLYKQHFTYRQN